MYVRVRERFTSIDVLMWAMPGKVIMISRQASNEKWRCQVLAGARKKAECREKAGDFAFFRRRPPKDRTRLSGVVPLHILGVHNVIDSIGSKFPFRGGQPQHFAKAYMDCD
jgi:hypothetical protein